MNSEVPDVMPNNPNAKKAMRQSAKRRLHNRTQRSALRTVLKKVHAAVDGGDATASSDAFKLACKRLDQAAAKNLIHKNKAARTKSRLSQALKKSQAAK